MIDNPQFLLAVGLHSLNELSRFCHANLSSSKFAQCGDGILMHAYLSGLGNQRCNIILFIHIGVLLTCLITRFSS